MPPEWLPTVGLSETYLVMSPLRNINQCHVASEVVMRALHLFGLPAEAVALEIEVENSRGSIVHHGRAQPQFANGQVLGHVGLIADDHFLDITASQYPEIKAHGGIRVVGSPLRGQGSGVLTTGAVMMTRLVDGHLVKYTAHPRGSADAVMQSDGLAAGEIEVLTNNLHIGYCQLLSSPLLIERVRSLPRDKYARFIAAVEDMKDKETDGTNGILSIVTPSNRI